MKIISMRPNTLLVSYHIFTYSLNGTYVIKISWEFLSRLKWKLKGHTGFSDFLGNCPVSMHRKMKSTQNNVCSSKPCEIKSWIVCSPEPCGLTTPAAAFLVVEMADNILWLQKVTWLATKIESCWCYFSYSLHQCSKFLSFLLVYFYIFLSSVTNRDDFWNDQISFCIHK